METIKTITDISIAMIVPREDVIRTVLIVAILPQAYLSQYISKPIMWYLSNLQGKQVTPIIIASLYILGILLFFNILLTFILTVACTAGNSKLSFMLWYLVVLLIFYELFFLAFFTTYSQTFIRKELTKIIGDLMSDNSKNAKVMLDDLQNQLQCCGANGPEDWIKQNHEIPDSCCDDRESADGLVFIKCPRYGIWYSTHGCAENQAKFMAPYPQLIASILWQLALLHIFLLIGAFWYRVMTKMDTLDRLMNKSLMEEFPPLPKPRDFPREPSPMTYYKTEYNKDHYMELMIKGESEGRWVPHYRFDKMRNAYQRLIKLKKRLNIT